MPRIGADSSRATGPAANGARVDMPMNRPTAPAATRGSEAPFSSNSPNVMATVPAAVSVDPTIARVRRDLGVVLAPVADIAATGGIDEARRAGRSAANSVTLMPTAIETMIVRASMVSGPSGIPNPAAFIAILISSATPIPARTPTAEATTARIAASIRTRTVTCDPVAPIARNKASSRTR